MNVEELLDLMEETLEEGTAMPFSAGKRMVDVDKMRDIIDDVRANLPDEMRQGKKIVEDRDIILQKANEEANEIIKKAEERAKVMTSEQEISKMANKYAMEVHANAQNQARELTRSAMSYCESILKAAEDSLARSMAEVKKTRASLRNRPPHKPK